MDDTLNHYFHSRDFCFQLCQIPRLILHNVNYLPRSMAQEITQKRHGNREALDDDDDDDDGDDDDDNNNNL